MDLLTDTTAEAINTSMLLQQTGASKHLEFPYFQGSRRQVLLPHEEKSDKGREGLFIFTFFMLKTTRCDGLMPALLLTSSLMTYFRMYFNFSPYKVASVKGCLSV